MLPSLGSRRQIYRHRFPFQRRTVPIAHVLHVDFVLLRFLGHGSGGRLYGQIYGIILGRWTIRFQSRATYRRLVFGMFLRRRRCRTFLRSLTF